MALVYLDAHDVISHHVEAACPGRTFRCRSPPTATSRDPSSPRRRSRVTSSAEHPLGIGGEALHAWHLGPTKDHPANRQVVSEMMDGMGATIMGRNMFGPIRGHWGDAGWRGWWGETPPYHCPVFVLTHHAHDPIEMKGGTTFHFVTDGVEAAHARAEEAAGGRPISVAGGASTARQAIAAGLVDEIDLQVNPVILGSGERLLDGFEAGEPRLELARVLEAPGVVHLRYRVIR